MKDELSGKMLEFNALRPRAYHYLIYEGDQNEKAKDKKRCVIKQNLKFKDYKNCLEANQLENELREKNDIEVDKNNRIIQ